MEMMACGVQVVARLRPLNKKEKADATTPVVSSSTKDSTVTVIRGSGARQSRTAFKVDNVFGSFATQEEVFDQTMPPIIKDVMRGFESTVFAYGQTGTGKTFTMEGDVDDEANMGIIPRAASKIFAQLQSGTYTESTVRVSYLEIYNDELNDLLAEPAAAGGGSGAARLRKVVSDKYSTKSTATSRTPKLQIVEDRRGKGVHCRGLIEREVSCVADVLAVIHGAQDKRRIGETKMNKASSRSHCLFTLVVESKEKTDGGGFVMSRTGKLHLVDLAGSECAKSAGTEDAKQERERKNINTSLLSLGRVILALKSKQGQVPYRDSKLTRLLQESLGGRCKTCIIATVSPSILCVEESMQTLKYAQQAHGIENKPMMTSRMGRAEGMGVGGLSSAGVGSGGGGGGGGDPALIESFCALETKCHYMEAQVEEAQGALARKHTMMVEATERADTAEKRVSDGCALRGGDEVVFCLFSTPPSPPQLRFHEF
jgi:hypothetical protein